jgi:hypothetical protein
MSVVSAANSFSSRPRLSPGAPRPRIAAFRKTEHICRIPILTRGKVEKFAFSLAAAALEVGCDTAKLQGA